MWPKGIVLTKKGTIFVDPFSLETSLCGVFAGGDAIFGAASIMEAISTGKQAAKSIDNYLKNVPRKSENNFQEVSAYGKLRT